VTGARAGSRVAVVGGGLAGMAAALRLASARCEVVLVERRPFLGGRAFSFRDPDTGAVIDNGQHVLVGACGRLRAFLSAIDSPRDAFARQRALSVPILDGRGRRGTLSAAPLPAPFHLLPALLRYRHLGLADRLRVARDARALAAYRDRSALEDVPLGAWLAARGATRAAVERFWEPLVTPALNAPVAEANAPLSAFFVERALWGGRADGALWLPQTGLSEAIGEPGLAALERVGVEIRAGERVDSVAIDAHRAVGVVLSGGEAIAADAVVCALAPREADAVLSPSDGDPAIGERRYGAIGATPIVNAYLWYDRPVAETAFAGTFGSPLQWIFDRERLLGAERSGGPCLGISLSAAWDWIDLSKDAIAERLDAAVERVLPRRRGARLEASAVVKEPRATFRANAGCARRRPGPKGPAAGLWLAGDWTDTGWPATMESAVRSGERAAAAALAGIRAPDGSTVADAGR
jgi:squalene-associated FAD-dependent desaturase